MVMQFIFMVTQSFILIAYEPPSNIGSIQEFLFSWPWPSGTESAFFHARLTVGDGTRSNA